jgi:hypothetical protein
MPPVKAAWCCPHVCGFDTPAIWSVQEVQHADRRSRAWLEAAEPGDPDTATCGCGREAGAVPEHPVAVLVEETSLQVDGRPVRMLNEADVEGENAVQLGDGYNEEFTGRKAVEFRIGQDVEDDAGRST